MEQIFIRAEAVFWTRAVVVLSGENAFPNRAPGQDRDSLAFAIRDDFRLDLSLEHVVAHLVRDDLRPREMRTRLLEVANREVAHADVPNPTRPMERLERLHRLPQRNLAPGIRPVHLVEIDLPHTEAL